MAGIRINTLGKADRLKSRKQIDGLFESGKKIMIFPFRVMYKMAPGGCGLKAGFTVSSKNFPRSVDRNRIKRLTREAYRLQKNPLRELVQKNRQQVALFLIYTGRELPEFPAVQKSIQQVLEKLVSQLHEGNSSNTQFAPDRVD
ncbi:MAG TPA: ribonuclease P protein component [Puia sp.]|jgi:ribonuclease P protein component